MPTIKELTTRISKAKKDIEKLRSKMIKDSEMLFKQSLKNIFKKHEKLTSFSWTQYTPHWNDGDECVFSAHTDYLYINGSEEDCGFWDMEKLYKDCLDKDKSVKKLEEENIKLAKKKDQKWQIESNERRIEEIKKADFEEIKWKYEFLKDANDLLGDFSQEALQEMFNNDVKVTVTKDGIETEEYEHD